MGYVLSKKYDFSIYIMDLRGIDDDGDVHFKETLWQDVKILARHIKNNSPDVPILLGGHGFGASVALNYATWRQKEPVNGYVFISPIVDVRSALASDQQVMKVANLRKMYNIMDAKYWFPPRSSSPIIQSLSFPNLSNELFWSPMTMPLWEAVISKNMIKQFREIDVPFGLWIGKRNNCSYYLV